MVCLPKSGLNDFVRKTESKDENKQMKDKKLLFDRKCHVLYSRPCKKEIRAKIALHYPAVEREAVWEKVQRRYAGFLSDWRTDLGGKRNFHNGVGGTYDCIAIMSYYAVCKAVTLFREIEEMEEKTDSSDFPQAEICGLQQAVLEEADVQGVCSCEKRLRQMARLRDVDCAL